MGKLTKKRYLYYRGQRTVGNVTKIFTNVCDVSANYIIGTSDMKVVGNYAILNTKLRSDK